MKKLAKEHVNLNFERVDTDKGMQYNSAVIIDVGDRMKTGKVILVCTECLARNYSVAKNKRVNTERLELNKFCKVCNKHTLHRETKQQEGIMKFKDWFSFKGIRAEMKHVSWLSKKELIKNSSIVVIFCLVFGLFFMASDTVIAVIFKVLGIQNMSTTNLNDEGRQWYVVNTYSGHENKVRENILKRVESMGIQDCLFNIVIPTHVETVLKEEKVVGEDGKKSKVQKKVNG